MEILEQIGGALALALFIGLWQLRKRRKRDSWEAKEQRGRELLAKEIAKAQRENPDPD
jgi:hypothetical protein